MSRSPWEVTKTVALAMAILVFTVALWFFAAWVFSIAVRIASSG
jgi:hypothetical protein